MNNQTEISNALSVCVIIPTKNRPHDLQLATRSLFAQTLTAGSLVIIDQSADDASKLLVESELANALKRSGPGWNLQYIRDSSISGAAAARNRAMETADGDIWLFLDDDVVLETDFVEKLLATYRDHREATGVSGIITNYPRPPLAWRLWSGLFMRGPFHDERQPIYWNAERLRNSPPLRVRGFTGASMSFRAEAIRGERLDEDLSAVWYVDDVDFCFRLGADAVLLIAPRVRLQHLHSPIGRLDDHWLRRHSHSNLFLYRRHWNRGLRNQLVYRWLWLGYWAAAMAASCRRFSLEPWHALRRGAAEANQAIPHPQRSRAT